MYIEIDNKIIKINSISLKDEFLLINDIPYEFDNFMESGNIFCDIRSEIIKNGKYYLIR